MKRATLVLLCLFLNNINAQKLKIVEMCDLKFETNKDSTEMVVSKNGEELSGKYSIRGVNLNQESITDFINGKAEGESLTIVNKIIVRRKYFKNGLPNGVWIDYDETGKKIIQKTPYEQGKKHGIGVTYLYGKEKYIYYLTDKIVSKEKYTEFRTN